jgi:hypothetical protein
MQIEKISKGEIISIDQKELNKIFTKLEYNLDDIISNNKKNEKKKIKIIKLPKINSNINKAKIKLLGILKSKC